MDSWYLVDSRDYAGFLSSYSLLLTLSQIQSPGDPSGWLLFGQTPSCLDQFPTFWHHEMFLASPGRFLASLVSSVSPRRSGPYS